MVVRAKYASNALTHEGLAVNIVPNATVTLYEPGTTTPLAQPIYASDVGATTRPNPFVTDSHGNVEFFLDSAQDVKIVAAGVGVGSITSDFERVMPAVSGMVFDGRALPTTLIGGLTVAASSPTAHALTLQNLGTGGKALRVLNDAGHPFLTAQKSPNGHYVVSVNHANTTVPDNNSLLVADTHSVVNATGGYVMADFGLSIALAGQDDGAFRAIASQTTPGGDSGFRAIEGHALRSVGSTASHGCWGMELGSHSSIRGTTPSSVVGIYLHSNNLMWGLGAVPVRANTGIMITGASGWDHGIRYFDTDNATTLFSVDQNGAVTAGTVYPRDHVTYNLGTPGAFWQFVYGLTFLTGGGSVGSPAVVSQAAPSSGMYWNGANPAVSVLGTRRGEWSPSGLTVVPATGSAALVKVGQQYAFAAGATANPSRTAATYADLEEMAVTLTTTGGDLIARFVGAFKHTDFTSAIVVALSLDGAAEAFSFAISVPVAAPDAFMILTMGRWSGVAAGSHTIKVRWLTGGATATANGVDRYLQVEEFGH